MIDWGRPGGWRGVYRCGANVYGIDRHDSNIVEYSEYIGAKNDVSSQG